MTLFFLLEYFGASTKTDYAKIFGHFQYHSIVGSVVECSPATRAARVQFPDDAIIFTTFNSLRLFPVFLSIKLLDISEAQQD